VELVFFMRLSDLSFLLVQPFAVIHDSADGRLACWSNLDKIKADFARLADCFVSVNDSDLPVLFVDQPNSICTDSLVYS